MEEDSLLDERTIDLIDILEQIEDVNRMIELHKNDDNSLMRSQYEYRRSKFLRKLGKALKEFSIRRADLLEMAQEGQKEVTA